MGMPRPTGKRAGSECFARGTRVTIAARLAAWVGGVVEPERHGAGASSVGLDPHGAALAAGEQLHEVVAPDGIGQACAETEPSGSTSRMTPEATRMSADSAARPQK